MNQLKTTSKNQESLSNIETNKGYDSKLKSTPAISISEATIEDERRFLASRQQGDVISNTILTSQFDGASLDPIITTDVHGTEHIDADGNLTEESRGRKAQEALKSLTQTGIKKVTVSNWESENRVNGKIPVYQLSIEKENGTTVAYLDENGLLMFNDENTGLTYTDKNGLPQNDQGPAPEYDQELVDSLIALMKEQSGEDGAIYRFNEKSAPTDQTGIDDENNNVW